MVAVADTIPSRFFEHAQLIGDTTAHYFWAGGNWYPVGWATMGRLVRDLAAGFIELGLEPGDRVAIWAEPRREWTYLDLAVMSAGGVSVGIFAGAPDAAVAAQLEHTGARICFVDSQERLARMARLRDRVPELEMVIGLEPKSGLDYHQLRAHGRRSTADVEARVRSIGAQDAATFVVASAGTGDPQVAMFTHGAVAAAATARAGLGLSREDLGYIALPMASAMARSMIHACIWNAIPIAYGRRIEHIGSDLQSVRPTFMAVPSRLFEHLHAGFAHFAESGAEPAARLALAWAQRVGREVSRAAREGRRLPRALAVQAQLARSVVFEGLRSLLGGRMRLVLTCGDQLPAEIPELFEAAGLHILEGWGIDETFSIGALNLPEHQRPGSAGRPLPGVSLAIAADGELLVSGECLFSGYFDDDFATAKRFTPDGAVRTGYAAELDEQGFCTVLGRKDALIQTPRGRVAPETIERFIRADPRISQVVVFGDGRDYLTALVSVHEAVRADKSEAQLCAMVEQILAEKNLQLTRREQIRKFRILPHDLSEASGELTPLLELRRAVVAQKFAYLVDEMY